MIDTIRAVRGRLAGSVAVISGGARGIGAATARRFADEGASVVLGDVRVDVATSVADEINSSGGAARATRLDVTDARSWSEVITTCLAEFGRPTVLVNNAGIQPVAWLAETSEDVLRRVIDVNLIGVYLGIQAVRTSMIEAGGGSIINLSSVAGFKATPGFSAYGCTKWAVRGLTKSAAVELGPDGIRVNSIHPGGIDTDMIKDPKIPEILATLGPRGAKAIDRLGTAEEVANLAVFLAGAESSFCTGSEFIIDGGTLAS